MTDYARLVERQLQMVEMKRHLERLGQRPEPARVEQVSYGPCLLISRECGSGGDQIAAGLAQRLHWQVFNREIVEEISHLARVHTRLVESVDEHVRSRWRRLLHPLQERDGIRPGTYLYLLHEIVLTLGHHGDVIIMGRGAQFILPPPGSVRLRIIGPLESRIHRTAQVRNLTVEAARQFVAHCDADRAEFIRKVFHQETDSPLNYDLVLNTGELSVEASIEITLATLRGKLRVEPEPAVCVK